jgi:hypothetical protein
MNRVCQMPSPIRGTIPCIRSHRPAARRAGQPVWTSGEPSIAAALLGVSWAAYLEEAAHALLFNNHGEDLYHVHLRAGPPHNPSRSVHHARRSAAPLAHNPGGVYAAGRSDRNHACGRTDASGVNQALGVCVPCEPVPNVRVAPCPGPGPLYSASQCVPPRTGGSSTPWSLRRCPTTPPRPWSAWPSCFCTASPAQTRPHDLTLSARVPSSGAASNP